MNIPNPKVNHGDSVLVLNYRCKPPRWDEGECAGVSYQDKFGGGFDWHYTVRIDRGKIFFLYVGNDGITKGRP